MTLVERYGPWALVTDASTPSIAFSLATPTFLKYNLQEMLKQCFLD